MNDMPMPGTIQIRDIFVRCIVGNDPDERINEQNLTLNLECDLDFREVAASDNLAHTVDYGELRADIVSEIQRRQFFILETLVAAMCNFLLEKYPRLDAVRLEVLKAPRSDGRRNGARFGVVRNRSTQGSSKS